MTLAAAARFWREALVLLCLLLALLAWAGKLRAERSLARAEARLVAIGAALDRQNEAVARWQAAARSAQTRSAAALAAARRQAPSVELRARRAETERPLSGSCRTPREVTEAGL